MREDEIRCRVEATKISTRIQELEEEEEVRLAAEASRMSAKI